MIPMAVFVVAMLVAAVALGQSQGKGARQWLRYQAVGVGAVLVAGLVGTVLQEGWLRFAFLVLALASVTRLVYLPRQARARVQ